MDPRKIPRSSADQAAEEIRKNTILVDAKNLLATGSEPAILRAVEMLEGIRDWKNAAQLIQTCHNRLQALRQGTQARLEEEREAEALREEAARRRKQIKDILLFAIPIAVVLIGLAVALWGAARPPKDPQGEDTQESETPLESETVLESDALFGEDTQSVTAGESSPVTGEETESIFDTAAEAETTLDTECDEADTAEGGSEPSEVPSPPAAEAGDAVFAGYSLDPTEELVGVRVYMKLNTPVSADDGARMQFTRPDGHKTQVSVPISTVDAEGESYHVFPVSLSVKEIVSPITAQMLSSDGVVISECTICVKDYLETLIATSSDASTLAFSKSLLNFAAATQVKFAYKTEQLANSGLSVADREIPPLEASALEDYRIGVSAFIDGVTYLGTSAVLETRTTLRHYFSIQDESVVFTLNGQTLTPVASSSVTGATHYVDVPAIPPSDMRTAEVLTVTCGGAEQTLTYSVYAYFHKILSLSTSSEASCDLIRAAYWYGLAVEQYASEHTDATPEDGFVPLGNEGVSLFIHQINQT